MVSGRSKISPSSVELRRRAEEQLKAAQSTEASAPLSRDDALRLLHELQVHQIELEMQNAELHLARDEVETLLARYTELYDFAPVGYFTLDHTGTIRAVNLSGATLLGVERSRLLGRRIATFITSADRPAFAAFLDKSLMAGVRGICEVQLLDEGDIPLVVHMESAAAASGQEVFVAARDVTERKMVEEKIRAINEELEDRVRERTVELDRMIKEMEVFCYSISHEIRAPISRIEGFSSVILEIAGVNADEQVVDCARRIATAGGRLRNVIDALLAMNRLSREKICREKLDLSSMAEQVVTDLREQFGQFTHNIVIAPDLTAMGDRGMLEVCLRNLLGNAIKYSSMNPAALVEFGQISIEGENVFFVRDNGVGLEMKYAQKVFNAFCRLHTDNESEGTGVGLATVLMIIERHNGRIWVEAEHGRGATFYFSLGGRGEHLPGT